jgi:hypothetical protein
MNIPLEQSTLIQSPTVSVYIQAIRNSLSVDRLSVDSLTLHWLSVVFGNGVLSECIFSENIYRRVLRVGFWGFSPRFPSTGD